MVPLKSFTMFRTFILSLIVFFSFSSFDSIAQSLPFDFEAGVSTSDFINFDGGVATVIANPQSGGMNTSGTVAQIIRNGGQIWGGSKINLSSNLDFTTNSTITLKVFTTAPVGTTVLLKLEDSNGAFAERAKPTTLSGQWETLSFDFTGVPVQFNYLVFMFDFGNLGDGSANSTFLFDDVEQIFSGTQIDLPVDFEGSTVNYAMSDFGGNQSEIVPDPTDPNNTVIKVVKTNTAATWAGTTIGTPAGFATDIPLTMTESFMVVRVWSPHSGILIRLKVEDSDDPTHTCETQVTSTVAGGWETLVFDFTNEAPGTELLSVGLSMGWTYNMASIFFNFDVDGATAGEKTYYFDDVSFAPGGVTLPEEDFVKIHVFPNPTANQWNVEFEKEMVQIDLYDPLGRMVQSFDVNGTTATIDASKLATGNYLLQLHTESGTYQRQVIKD